MSVRLYFFLFHWLILIHSLSAQPGVVRGIVVDKETNQPLPFASVYFENTSIGTRTNNAGEFVLNSQSFPKVLVVSHIGYGSFKKEFFANESLRIYLVSEATTLTEVTIYPKDTLRDLIKKCFNNIPNNYSYKPFQLELFYRQTLTDTIRPFYLCEAAMQYQASGYQHSTEFGNVRILRSKIDIRNDSIDYTHHYGGPFIARFCDFVKRRSSFIKGKNDFEYSLKEKFKIDGKEIDVIEFQGRQKNQPRGLIYIDVAEKVFLKLEKLSSAKDFPYVHITTTYKKIGKKWFVESIHYKHRGQNKKSGKPEIATVDMVTTKLNDPFTPIPLDQQYNYGQPFTLSKQTDGATFWKGRNILMPDSGSQQPSGISYQYAGNSKSKNRVNKNRSKFIGRFGGGFSLQFLPYPTRSVTPPIEGVTTGGQTFVLHSSARPDLLINFSSKINFQLSNRVNFFFSAGGNLNVNYINQTADLGIGYSFLLDRKRSGILIKPAISYCWNTFGQGYEHLTQDFNFRFNGSTYSQSNTRFFLGNSTENVRLHLGAERRVGSIWRIFVNTAFQLPIMTPDARVILREGRGPLSRLHESTINANSITVTEPYDVRPPRLMIEIGLRYSLL